MLCIHSVICWVQPLLYNSEKATHKKIPANISNGIVYCCHTQASLLLLPTPRFYLGYNLSERDGWAIYAHLLWRILQGCWCVSVHSSKSNADAPLNERTAVERSRLLSHLIFGKWVTDKAKVSQPNEALKKLAKPFVFGTSYCFTSESSCQEFSGGKIAEHKRADTRALAVKWHANIDDLRTIK